MRSLLLAVFPALALATAAPAFAATGEAYQFAIVKGTATYGQVLVRVSTTTGQSILCVGTGPCIPVTDAAPAGAGDYRVSSWETIDATGAQRYWNVTRMDVRSGRMWLIGYDGKTTASWTEAK